MRKPPKGKSLAEVNPELAKEWHPTKNASLTANDIVKFSHKKVWWKCDKGEDHVWLSSVANRSKGKACPVCSGQKIVLSNCLATIKPNLAKEWHPSKNVELTPYDVSANSGKKVWWKCDKGEDHEWITFIGNRSNGNGCPICSGYKIVLSNCLTTMKPNLAKEWHPTKNDPLTPFDVYFSSHKKVWWKCDKGEDHEWITSVESRAGSRETGCPICVGQKTVLSNCLATLNPNLAKEWHPTKNGSVTPYDVTIGSSRKKVWWKCDKGEDHEWRASVASRTNGNGCSVCANITIVQSNCLATLNPKLAKEWHPTKNEELTPFDVPIGSEKKVWWQCDKGEDHEWITSIAERSNGKECPICSGHKTVLSNCLATLNPNLTKEWHPTKNDSLSAFDVTLKSGKKVWWKCDKGEDHEWITSISHRANGRQCPYCTLTPQSKQELTITFELIQFFKINPKGFKARIKGKTMSIDIYIPKLNLGIEFDGSYWHKGKRELDKLKTEKLEDDGFKIMRVREEPLKAISDIDIISKTPFNAKDVTDNILKHILKTYSLDKRKADRINKYLLKNQIQNEKGLDMYIEKILTEKAEKKGE